MKPPPTFDSVKSEICDIPDRLKAILSLTNEIKNWKGAVEDIPKLFRFLFELKTVNARGTSFTLIKLVSDIVNDLIDEKAFDRALTIIRSPIEEKKSLILVLEIELRILYSKTDSLNDEANQLLEQMTELNMDITFPETHLIFGYYMIERDHLHIALQSVEEGLQKAKDRRMKKLINRLELLRDEISPKVKELEREEERNKAKLKDEKKAKKKNANLKKKKEREELNKKKKLEKEQKNMENKENKKRLEEEGLEDPKEKAKSETRDWINSVVGKLGSQINSFEAEMEGLSVKKGETRPPRLMHLEASIARHKAHEMKLESILRLLENEEWSPEQVNVVKDSLEDYVKHNQEDFDKFSDVDELYNALPKDKVEALKESISTHIVETQSGPDCYVGTSETNGIVIRHSFIRPQQSQIDNFQRLVKICSSHRSLISLDYVVKDKDMDPFLVTEEVYSLEDFFKREFNRSEKRSNEDWWNYVKKMYWIIFRDIIKGLIYLLSTRHTCGNLSFNLFVTAQGRGRILPSFQPSQNWNADVLSDLKDLSMIMKSVLIPLKEVDDSFLPDGLQSFFLYIAKAKTFMSNGLPPEFLLDHPFFWCVQEKVYFSLKLQEFRKLTPEFNDDMEYALEFLEVYENWFEDLSGIYKKVYDEAVKHSKKPHDYRQRLDIIRFVWAVYSHINQKEYESLRGKEKMTPEEIEKDLMSYFPRYYTNMFEGLCRYSRFSENPSSLMHVSTLKLRALDDPATMFDAARPETT